MKPSCFFLYYMTVSKFMYCISEKICRKVQYLLNTILETHYKVQYIDLQYCSSESVLYNIVNPTPPSHPPQYCSSETVLYDTLPPKYCSRETVLYNTVPSSTVVVKQYCIILYLPSTAVVKQYCTILYLLGTIIGTHHYKVQYRLSYYSNETIQ